LAARIRLLTNHPKKIVGLHGTGITRGTSKALANILEGLHLTLWPRKILLRRTSLCNGSIHLGHLVEHVQTDIWVRYPKMRRA